MLKTVLAVAAVGLMVGSARALTTTIDSSYALGTVVPGSPADPVADEYPRLAFLVDKYNDGQSGEVDNPADTDHVYTLIPGANVPSPDLPAPILGDYTGQLGGTLGAAAFSLTLTGGTTYDYLLCKWSNVDVYYYVAGLTEMWVVNDLVSNDKGKAQNLSHYVLFNGTSVPDGGMTVGLLGMALGAMGLLMRKIA